MLKSNLRSELTGLLENGWAHEGPQSILADFPLDRINEFPPNVPYTPWHVLEHMRFCQQEVLELLLAEEMPAYTFPDDFWPSKDAVATAMEWQVSLNGFFADLARFQELARDADLAQNARNREDFSMLHAIFNIAAHNHYHLGEFAVLRQVMGTWPEGRNPVG